MNCLRCKTKFEVGDGLWIIDGKQFYCDSCEVVISQKTAMKRESNPAIALGYTIIWCAFVFGCTLCGLLNNWSK